MLKKFNSSKSTKLRLIFKMKIVVNSSNFIRKKKIEKLFGVILKNNKEFEILENEIRNKIISFVMDKLNETDLHFDIKLPNKKVLSK